MRKYRYWEVRGCKGAYEVPVLRQKGRAYQFKSWAEVAAALEAFASECR